MTGTEMQEREELETLLPWHATGQLSAHDAARVEAALARDAVLAQRYQLVLEEMAGSVELNETLGAPSARAFNKLMAAIDAEPARRARTAGLAERFADFIASLTPRTLAFSGAAAALVIVLQAAVITGTLMSERGGSYQTASAPAEAAGTHVAIRFGAQVTAAEITQFLTEHKLTINGGPLANGMFRVKLADTQLSRDDLLRAVRRLQEDKRVEMIATSQ